jgi:hypothetical protein
MFNENDEIKDLIKLPRVTAPPGFEQAVVSRLHRAKIKRQKVRKMEFAFSGIMVSIILIFLIFNQVFQKSEYATGSIGKSGRQEEIIPIVEPVNFRKEIMKKTEDPQTVYILEQVSDGLLQQAKF